MLLAKRVLTPSLRPFLQSTTPRACVSFFQTRQASSLAPTKPKQVAHSKDVIKAPTPKQFPATTSPLIDESTETIHKIMSKFVRSVLGGDKVDSYSAKLISLDKEMELEQNGKTPLEKVKPSLFIGHIVEFAYRGGFEIGYVSSAAASSVSVTTVDGTTLAIAPDQVSYVWPQDVGNVTPETLKALHEELPTFLEKQPLRKRDMTDAWKKLCLFIKVPYTSVLLSKIMFNSTSPIAVYATFRMLASSSYFKRWDQSTNGYKMYNASGLKGTALYKFVKKVQQKLDGEEPEWDPLSDALLKEDLSEFARAGGNAPARSIATTKFVLQRVGLEISPQSAAALLSEIGAPVIDESESKKTSPLAKEQADKIFMYVQKVKGKFTKLRKETEFEDADRETRQDLTHHHVMVIDSSDTLASDTGLSMQVSEDGNSAIIYLHIADPTRWLTPSDPISQSAYNTTATLYFPSGAWHMLPISFITSTTLSDQRENYTLTAELEVDPETGQLKSSKFYPSITGSVTRTTFKHGTVLLSGGSDDSKKMSKSAQAHFTSLLQNLTMLKDARLASAPYNLPITTPFKPHPYSDIGFARSEIADSTAFPGLHYVTVLADEAIAKFAKTNDIPLPSPTNFTRPLRSYAGMVTHWQIKAAVREAQLPFNNAEMDTMRTWLWRKSNNNNALVSRMKEDSAQQSLRKFYKAQRAVIGKDEVLLLGEVTKMNAAEHKISVSIREFQYKSVIQLKEENFNKVQLGGTVVLRLRERPTHIGMAFVSVMDRSDSNSHSAMESALPSVGKSNSNGIAATRRSALGGATQTVSSTVSKPTGVKTTRRSFST